jgi:hypothetical protein
MSTVEGDRDEGVGVNIQGPRPRWWITAAAYAVPLCILPSAAWRMHLVIDTWARQQDNACMQGGGIEIYLTFLSLGSFALGLLTIGLVRPWGEIFPRWIPVVGGQVVPVRGVTAIAGTGAALIGLLVAYFLLNQQFQFVEGPLKPLPPGCHVPDFDVLVWYVPLVAWPPLLALVTWDYHRRRTITSTTTPTVSVGRDS